MTYLPSASDTYGAVFARDRYTVSMSFKVGLRKAMDHADVDQGGLARLLSISRPAVTQWLSGTTTPKGARLQQIAAVLHTTTAALFGSEEDAQAADTVPVVGYVGAGTEIFPIDDGALNADLERVPAPPGSDVSLVAVIVRGNSMIPAFWEGDLLFYTRLSNFDINECLYKECVVKVVDGAIFVKTVMPGQKKGLFTLQSLNSAPIFDIQIEWVAPIQFHDMRRRSPRTVIAAFTVNSAVKRFGEAE